MLKIENTPVDDKINRLVVKSMYNQSLKRNQKTKLGRNFLFHLYATTVIKVNEIKGHVVSLYKYFFKFSTLKKTV